MKSILVNRKAEEGGEGDILYEMGPQYGILMDLNHE